MPWIALFLPNACRTPCDRMRAPPLAAATMISPASPVSFESCAISARMGSSPLPDRRGRLNSIIVVSRHDFRVANYGRIYGMSLAAFQVAIGIGPLIVGLAYDRAQSYAPALSGLLVCLGAAAVLFAFLGRSIYEREPERFKAVGAV